MAEETVPQPQATAPKQAPSPQQPASAADVQPPAPTKQGPAGAAAGKAPEKYELKPPEGSLLEQASVDAVVAYAKEKGLTQEQAQELLNRESSAVMSFHGAQQKNLERLSEQWAAELRADKEIGGEHFEKNVEMAKRVLTKFGNPEFVKDLEATGLGNHPGLVRTFIKIGKAMSDDQLVLPGAQAGGEKSAVELFYGKAAP